MARPAGSPVDYDRNVRVEPDQIAAQQGLIAESFAGSLCRLAPGTSSA